MYRPALAAHQLVSMGSKMDSNFLLQSCLHGMLELPVSLTGWQAEVVEKDGGEFSSKSLLLQAGPLQMTVSSSNKSLVVMGENPVGCQSFLVQLTNVGPYVVYGNEVSSQEIATKSAELDAVTPAGVRVVDMSIQWDYFDELQERWECESLFDNLRNGGAFRPAVDSLNTLKAELVDVFAHVCKNPDPSLFYHIREDVLTAFSECVFSTCPGRSSASLGSRKRTVKQAVEYVRSNELVDMTVPDIARAASVSERTLQYAFRQQLGITPKGFLKRYRLHGIHRDLRKSEGGSVTSIARQWGFWHMGQLGVDYKRLFGEPPSKTLRKMPRKAQFLVPPAAMTDFGRMQ